MYEAIRIFWNLAAVGGAIAVGLITQSAGLIAVTLLGGLFVPRLLGLVPRGPRGFRGFGWGPGSCMGRGGHGRLGSCLGRSDYLLRRWCRRLCDRQSMSISIHQKENAADG